MNQVPLRVIKTGKTDLRHNSPSFLTLITTLQSHSVFYIHRTPNAERRMTLKFSEEG